MQVTPRCPDELTPERRQPSPAGNTVPLPWKNKKTVVNDAAMMSGVRKARHRCAGSASPMNGNTRSFID
jgi:hypothetical protein